MKSPACVLLFVACLSQTAVAEELRYSGQLAEVRRGGGPAVVKEFEVTCWVDADRGTAFYLTREGRPALPWVEQYGQSATSDQLFSKTGAMIGYRHEERHYTVPVALPFFPEFNQLEPGAAWERGGIAYEVAGERSVEGHRCWQVRVRTGPARTHTLLVRQDRPLVLEATQTVFMGQGDRFQLTLQLTESRDLEPDQAEKLGKATAALLELKAELERDEHDRFAPLSSEQVSQANEHVAALTAVSEGTPLASLVKGAAEDLQMRAERMSRVDGLAKELVGRPAPKFTLTNLSGKPVDADQYAGKLTVLHFWEYRDEPLEQPYGQVGYLEFLNARWKEKDVAVYGVAIDSRLSSAETRAEGIRSIRRLQQFMRLGYDITYDGGAVLNAFGNPTRLGEELPLWVVISPDGDVIHYKTGYYEVDNKVGLKELDGIVQEQLR
jgi:hypothetical protein